jgi:Predicted transcriptional regulator
MHAPPPRLGKMQLQIMQVLWDRGEATARQITEELCRTTPIAHSTVQTLLRKMEAKGAITHDASERIFVFRPLYPRHEVNGSVAQDILKRVFGGSVYGLVSHLFKSETISADEMRRLRELIEESERRAAEANGAQPRDEDGTESVETE